MKELANEMEGIEFEWLSEIRASLGEDWQYLGGDPSVGIGPAFKAEHYSFKQPDEALPACCIGSSGWQLLPAVHAGNEEIVSELRLDAKWLKGEFEKGLL